MFKILFILFEIYFINFCQSDVFFHENFYDESYTDIWLESSYHGIDQGKFELGLGENFGDYWTQRGLKTSENSKYFGISAAFKNPFDNRGRNLVFQYQVKVENQIECGGLYMKLLGSDIDQKKFYDKTPYKIMFGPDICGEEKQIIHVILSYRNNYYSIKKTIRCKYDEFSHLYTLIIMPNNTYELLIDNKVAAEGSIEDDFDMLPPKEIQDPSAEKPENWDDREKIDDPDDKKPDDWDQPIRIPDASAKKPEHWDEENDVAWTPPLIPNPKFKGKWMPRKINNPKFNGTWKHPMIHNPNYYSDDFLYLQEDIGAIGIDVWQVKGGSIFDNILITDDRAHAFEMGENTWRIAFNDEVHAINIRKETEEKHREQLKKLDEERRLNEEEDEEEEEEENLETNNVPIKEEL